MVAGHGLSVSDTTTGYVVNETLLKKLNVINPNDVIGKTFRINGWKPKPIVGVVKDFYNLSLKESISPVVLFSSKRRTEMLAVKMETKDIKDLMPQVEKIWNNTFPDYVYGFTFMDEVINGYYKTEQVMAVLFKTFAGVIIFISFIGLFGLISFVASQRTKEVAIRKVLGASTLELVKMLNGTFLLMVFFANLVAWPIAYILVDKWLSAYTYRIELSVWPFLIAMFISMLITLVTVSLRSFKAARTNPIDALKYE